MKEPEVKIVECPRDAMQGLETFVPTALKIMYLNQLLQVGFHTLDCGSFVSPKAVPQMRDTADVLAALDRSRSNTRLLVIIANTRGADEALTHPEIDCLGFPLSVSETFQQRNTNQSIAQALDVVRAVQERCVEHHRTLVVYLSMGFGNPYGEAWSPQLLSDFTLKMQNLGVRIVSLADTIGAAQPEAVAEAYLTLGQQFPEIEFGAHFHAAPNAWEANIEAAWNSGCRRFDGALRGFGGCPFAADALVGNIATEHLIQYVRNRGKILPINDAALTDALAISSNVFQAAH